MLCDAHIHFFSPGFFAGRGASRNAIAKLGWEFPDSTEALSVRWIQELDKHRVERAALGVANRPDLGDAETSLLGLLLRNDLVLDQLCPRLSHTLP